MLQIINIRKIPEYMIKLIKEKDKTTTQDGNVRFYKYFTKYNKELCEVIGSTFISFCYMTN